MQGERQITTANRIFLFSISLFLELNSSYKKNYLGRQK
uniref:Uncharacterized protein n=1 Tax=Anguilla anguilla TaxID=7936 RepID=A0A0E9T7C9_ANGAN